MQAAPRRITPYSPFAPCRGERRNYLASTNYPTSVPTRIQISPGVWSDGKDRVFSSTYPPVQHVLHEARATLKQPTSSNEVVFALAALDVFYKPADPAHWVFWSDEKKQQTAEVVSRIALQQPPLIRTSVAWNGTSEYLYILANQHGSSYRHAYEDQPWFRRLVPQKSSAAPKVLNLRKRKPNPGAFREPSKSPGPEDEDVEEPPRKRSKHKPTKSPEPSISTGKSSSDATENSSANKTSQSASASAIAKDNSHENLSQQPGTLDQDNMPVDGVASTRMSTRNRKAIPSQTASSSSRASSVSPVDNSANSSASHSRNRSISHTSSQTAVPSNNSRRSASVLSAATAVDGRSSAAKGKQPACDGVDQTHDGKESSDAQSDEEGMVTRGRASRTRVDFSKIISEADSDRVKNGKQTLNTARNSSQKTKRKL